MKNRILKLIKIKLRKDDPSKRLNKRSFLKEFNFKRKNTINNEIQNDIEKDLFWA